MSIKIFLVLGLAFTFIFSRNTKAQTAQIHCEPDFRRFSCNSTTCYEVTPPTYGPNDAPILSHDQIPRDQFFRTHRIIPVSHFFYDGEWYRCHPGQARCPIYATNDAPIIPHDTNSNAQNGDRRPLESASTRILFNGVIYQCMATQCRNETSRISRRILLNRIRAQERAFSSNTSNLENCYYVPNQDSVSPTGRSSPSHQSHRQQPREETHTEESAEAK